LFVVIISCCCSLARLGSSSFVEAYIWRDWHLLRLLLHLRRFPPACFHYTLDAVFLTAAGGSSILCGAGVAYFEGRAAASTTVVAFEGGAFGQSCRVGLEELVEVLYDFVFEEGGVPVRGVGSVSCALVCGSVSLCCRHYTHKASPATPDRSISSCFFFLLSHECDMVAI
jgi:hypothetical protein